MPPKKRKSVVSSTASTPAKRVRIGGASNIPDPQLPSLSPSVRPKRASASEPKYNFTAKRRSSTDQTPVIPAANSTVTEVRKRGRPPKASPTVEVAPKKSASKKSEATISSTPTKHGRTAIKQKTTTTSSKATPPKRGRKPKGTKSAIQEPVSESENQVINESAAKAGETTKTEDLENVDQDIQYWLMKAEPESRIEKGHDVKFSIDDLAAKTEPEGWDGVRNAVARNNMRAMRKGDLAFFYHSNCSVPGIAGVMRIVEEHSVDESAFDPNHPYYDPKSDREKPKWELVKVEFVKKFDQLVTLRELKSLSLPGSALQNMVMLKQGRLSVSPVAGVEWRFILDLAGEKPYLGHPTPQDGYESDVDSNDHEETPGGGGEVVGEVVGPVAGSSLSETPNDFSPNIFTNQEDPIKNGVNGVHKVEA